MRVYYPVNEFSEFGYAALPLAVYLCDKLVLWSPMSKFIDCVYDEGKSILNSKHILQLVESGNIQIAGREQWFDKKYRDSLPFYKAHYSEFDTEVNKLLYISTFHELNDNYVIVAPKESGSSWAKKTLLKNNDETKQIIDYAKSLISNPQSIPSGVYEKLVRVPEESRLQYFVQIMRNNIKTLDQVECNSIIYWKDYFADAVKISNYKFKKKAAYSYPDINKIIDMIEYLQSITEIKDFKNYMQALQSRDIKEVKNEINRVLDSQLNVNEEYLLWYQEVIKQLKAKQGKKIEILIDGCFSVASIITILMGFYLNYESSFQFSIELHDPLSIVTNVGGVYSLSKSICDIKKYRSMPVNYPVIPFIGGEISERTRIKKYNELIKETKKRIY